VARVVGLERGRGDVVGPAPDLDLGLAVLLGGLGLVQALQRAVVTLVQAPLAVDGEPVEVQLAEDEPEERGKEGRKDGRWVEEWEGRGEGGDRGSSCCSPEGADRALQHGRVRHIELEALCVCERKGIKEARR
jgi:hypothetical protein